MVMEPMAERSVVEREGVERAKLRGGVKGRGKGGGGGSGGGGGEKRKREGEQGEGKGGGEEERKKKRVRGPKGPNPLSVKKAKKGVVGKDGGGKGGRRGEEGFDEEIGGVDDEVGDWGLSGGRKGDEGDDGLSTIVRAEDVMVLGDGVTMQGYERKRKRRHKSKVVVEEVRSHVGEESERQGVDDVED